MPKGAKNPGQACGDRVRSPGTGHRGGAALSLSTSDIVNCKRPGMHSSRHITYNACRRRWRAIFRPQAPGAIPGRHHAWRVALDGCGFRRILPTLRPYRQFYIRCPSIAKKTAPNAPKNSHLIQNITKAAARRRLWTPVRPGDSFRTPWALRGVPHIRSPVSWRCCPFFNTPTKGCTPWPPP